MPPPPTLDVTCGFLTQLVFSIKICLRHQSVTPLLSGAPLPRKLLDLLLTQPLLLQ